MTEARLWQVHDCSSLEFPFAPRQARQLSAATLPRSSALEAGTGSSAAPPSSETASMSGNFLLAAASWCAASPFRARTSGAACRRLDQAGVQVFFKFFNRE
jgi:hypothetical protein